MRKPPYIVHINPHARLRDPVDLRTPTEDLVNSGTALGIAMIDAVGVWWIRFWDPRSRS